MADAIVLTVTLGVSFERLLVVSNAITLAVFVLVDLALWRLQLRGTVAEGFRAPPWVRPIAAATCMMLLVAVLLFSPSFFG